jgi:hypothetical protein
MSTRTVLSVLTLAALSAACGASSDTTAAEDPARLRLRIAVADAVEATVSVYDVADREISSVVALDARVTDIVASHTGETAVLVREGGGAVQLLSSGVSVIPHKDHVHIFKSRPELLGSAIEHPGSVNVAFGSGQWGAFFSGSEESAPGANALVVAEEPWLQGTREPTPVEGSLSHRGYALPVAGSLLVTRRTHPTASDARADSIEVFQGGARGATGSAPPKGALVACAELEGAATNGEVAAFACRDGVVVVGADGAASAPLAYAGPRIVLLQSLAGKREMLATDEAGALFRLDLDGLRLTPVTFEVRACDAVLEIATPPRVVALGEDGRVRRWDLAADRAMGTSEAAVAPFACDAAVRPHLAASPDRAWVSSPSTGEIVEVDTAGGGVVRRIAVGGSPGPIAALGLDPRNVDVGLGNDNLSD